MLLLLAAICFGCCQATSAQLVLEVHSPGYQAFLVNSGSTPVVIDYYKIESLSESLDYEGWLQFYEVSSVELESVFGPQAGPFFDIVGPAETGRNLIESTTGSLVFDPTLSWSIGTPFDWQDPAGFEFDPVFTYRVKKGDLVQGAVVLLSIPEPSTKLLLFACFGLAVLKNFERLSLRGFASNRIHG